MQPVVILTGVKTHYRPITKIDVKYIVQVLQVAVASGAPPIYLEPLQFQLGTKK